MSPKQFNTFCQRLPHTTYVMQWGGSHVWKVGGKVFAIGSLEADGELHVTFKCSALAFEVLKQQPGCRPAPYLASRGFTWIQRTDARAMSDRSLQDHLRASHEMVAAGLTKAMRRQLGIAD